MGISLCLAALNPDPLRLIQKSALGETLGRERIYFNLERAVSSFQANKGTPLPQKQGRQRNLSSLNLQLSILNFKYLWYNLHNESLTAQGRHSISCAFSSADSIYELFD
jgi:hypothetical protein